MGDCRKSKVWPVAFALGAGGVLAFWQWVMRADVLTYGAPTQTYLKINTDPDDKFAMLRRERNLPVEVTEGDEFEICFAGVTWYRLCQGTLTTHLTPTFGTRFDFPVYPINTPLKVGPVAPKCRKIAAPALGGRAGPFAFNGHARFTCWISGAPDVQLPSLKLDILRK